MLYHQKLLLAYPCSNLAHISQSWHMSLKLSFLLKVGVFECIPSEAGNVPAEFFIGPSDCLISSSEFQLSPHEYNVGPTELNISHWTNICNQNWQIWVVAQVHLRPNITDMSPAWAYLSQWKAHFSSDLSHLNPKLARGRVTIAHLSQKLTQLWSLMRVLNLLFLPFSAILSTFDDP